MRERDVAEHEVKARDSQKKIESLQEEMSNMKKLLDRSDENDKRWQAQYVQRATYFYLTFIVSIPTR